MGIHQVRHTAFIVDDDLAVREGLSNLLRSVDVASKAFPSAEDFLKNIRPEVPGCLVLDVRLPGKSGLEFQEELVKRDFSMPIIFITGHGDVPMCVQAMKAGAVEFLCKPFREDDLLRAVRVAFQKDTAQRQTAATLSAIRQNYETLTPREREVMIYVVSGLMNKQVAFKLNLSVITVKVHRASIMRKMQAGSLAELVRQADALRLGAPN
jgi:FixJ family two-component response regulator